MLFTDRSPTAADVMPTFAPELTAAPSPSPTITPLPPPISRPDDAHGIPQTTAPYRAPAPFSSPVLPDSLWLSTAPLFTVPCTLHAQRVYVPVVVNGRPETFLLDSGVPFSTIDPAVAPTQDVPIKLRTLQIGEVRFNALTAGVAKVEARARTYYGAPIDGVLGQELFSRYPVKIDYRNCAVTIYRDSTTALAEAGDSMRQVPLRMINGVPTVSSSLLGEPVTLDVDTGSDAEVDATQAFASAHALVPVPNSVPELRRVLPGAELRGETLRAADFSVGSVIVEGPLVGVVAGEAPFDNVDGDIGGGLLAQTTVLFDETGGELLLAPARVARPAYDRSGAWLILRPNGVVIKSVLPYSPAERADLRQGDRILAIGGSANPDLEAARTLLAGTPGTTLTVKYERNGAVHAAPVTLRTLL